MRIARLDGIRGLAVLLIVLHHHAFAPWGWVGVDVFFVLSGFLITGILENSKGRADYWKSFYTKRATRILPPLLLITLLAFAVSRNVKVSTALCTLFFLSNVGDVLHIGSASLGATWSLAIEEHFYLLWPVAVLYLSRKRLIQLSTGILVVEPLIRLVASQYVSWEAIYLLTPFRLDGLAAGSLLALVLESKREVIARWSGLAFLSLIGVYCALEALLWPRFNRDTLSSFTSIGYTLIALFSLALIAYVVTQEQGWVSSTLSWRPLVYVGRISYGMYLFHMFILASTEKLFHVFVFPTPAAVLHKLLLIDLPLTVAMAHLSFRFIESPALVWGRAKLKGRPQVQQEDAQLIVLEVGGEVVR